MLRDLPTDNERVEAPGRLPSDSVRAASPRPDEPWVGRVAVDLPSQPAAVDRDRRHVAEVPSPDPAQERFLGERLAAVAHQVGQQVELTMGQAQRLVT